MRTTNKWFDPGRFALMLRRDLSTHYKGVLIGAGAIVAFFTFLMVIVPSFSSEPEPLFEDFHTAGYLIAVFLGGLWFSSGIWSDVNTTQQRQHYLTIPASNLEKYASKWLITGPVFLIVATIAYYVFSIMINGLAGIFPKVEYFSFDLFNETNMTVMPLYLFIHPFYLAVGIWFERFAFVKGSLIQILIQMIYIGFVVGLISLLFSGMEDQVETGMSMQFNAMNQIGFGNIVALQYTLGALTALFFGYLGYLRLTERGA